MMDSTRRMLLCFSSLLFLAASAWGQNITGVVKDETGQPLPGATVVIQGTTNGANTDIDGKFTISNVKPGEYTLVFSYIGYQKTTQKVTLAADGTQTPKIDFSMKPNSELLKDVVVVGYGVQRKRDVTGAITTVQPKEITDVPTPSFEAGLQGKAAGVQVTTGSGLAGSASIVRIRGISSISASGDPLYVVDGIPIVDDNFLGSNRGGMNQNPLATINPDDIASIEILKDASATGIYGSRGANGVILITTKRGSQKGMKVSFDGTFGVSLPTVKPPMLNSDQWLQLRQEAWNNDGGVGLAPLPGGITWAQARKTNTDWVAQTIGTGIKHSYNVSVNRGWDKVKSYFSVGYNHNGTYLLGNSYDRLSARANVDWDVAKNLKISGNTSFSQGLNNRVDAAWSGGLGAAMSTALPIYPVRYQDTVFDSNGAIAHLPGDYWADGSNPVRQRELQTWRTRESQLLENLAVHYTPFKNFTVAATGSYEYLDVTEDRFQASDLRSSSRLSVVPAIAERWPTWTNNWNTNLTGTYLWDMNDNNHFTFMVGSEYQATDQIGVNYIAYTGNGTDAYPEPTGTFYQHKNYLNAPDSLLNNPAYTTPQHSNFLSYFTRINYSYKNRYYLQASFRADGSSKFGANNRFGYFPAVSGGWIISDEDWMKGQSIFSYLKLKAGYGLTGNAGIPNYQQYGSYNYDSYNYNNQPIRYLAIAPNPDLKWETTQSVDAGLDMGFLKDRLTVNLSVYKKNTSDVLLNVTPQPSSGYASIFENLGSILNEGAEIQINATVISKPHFTWKTNFNSAYNYNEITSIGNYTPDAVSGGTNDTRVVVGKPVGTNYLVRFSHVDAATGKPVYLDQNGNETYTWDPSYRVAVGRVLPKAVGGWTNTWTYKNWELGLVMVYSVGSNIYDGSGKRQLGVVTDWNMTTAIADRWRQEGDIATYPRLTLDPTVYGISNAYNYNTTLFLEKGDYLRFRRISLTYNFPKEWLNKMKVGGASLTLSATNFFTITDYKGLDPEIARDFADVTDRNMSPNITYLTPPQEMTFNLAVHVNF